MVDTTGTTVDRRRGRRSRRRAARAGADLRARRRTADRRSPGVARHPRWRVRVGQHRRWSTASPTAGRAQARRRRGRGRVPPGARAPVPRRRRGLLRGAGVDARPGRRRSASTGRASPSAVRARAAACRRPSRLLARDRGGPPLCFQFLGIPELDHRLETTSMRTFVDTPIWHRRNAELSWEALPRARAAGRLAVRVAVDRRGPDRSAAGLRHDDGVRSAARRGDPSTRCA